MVRKESKERRVRDAGGVRRRYERIGERWKGAGSGVEGRRQGEGRRRKARRTPLDLPKLAKRLLDILRRLPRLLDPPDIQRPVLPVEASDSTHVVAVPGVLLAAEDVESGVGEDMRRGGEAVEVGAFLTVGIGVVSVSGATKKRESKTKGKGEQARKKKRDEPERTATPREEEADVLTAISIRTSVASVLLEVYPS